MEQWVLTVAGIAILSVLCDIILPEGQTRKYVKTVFGVVVTLVIVLPIVNLFNENFTFSSVTESQPTVQQQYLDSIDGRLQREKEQSLKSVLQANGIDVVSVSLDGGCATVRIKGSPSAETEKKVIAVVGIIMYDCEAITEWV